MARLTWECIAPKEENGYIIKYWNKSCDRCKRDIKIGETYLRVRDGFGYNFCVDCYIDELKSEIINIDYVIENNKKLRDNIDRLQKTKV